MSSWIPRTVYNGIEYGGNHDFLWWDIAYNPGAVFDAGLNTYDLSLPNCTCYCIGRILEAGDSLPVAGLPNANQWHNNLINGWTYQPFNYSYVEPGDILEWSVGTDNHVAVVESVNGLTVYVSQSFYTDDNGGTSGYRTGAVWGSTKASVSAYGLANYPNRFFSYALDTSAYGHIARYILKNPAHHGSDIDPEQMYAVIKRKRKLKKVVVN